jgi:twitching motility protein PilT
MENNCEGRKEEGKMGIIDYLNFLVKEKGSDIHLCAGRKPHIRINGRLTDTGFDVLRPEEIKTMIYNLLNEEQIGCLKENKELDISHMLPGVCRFRINIYVQRGSLALVARMIPWQVEPFEQLGIPPVVKKFADSMNGLVMVTGPQGSGKTTTIAAIIDYINNTRKAHIITIEDPIEYYHRSKKSIVNQREVSKDTFSYSNAVKYILRQDPDVCLIGEIRDADSARAAITLAEAGILVLTTLHSPTAVKAISRIVELHPPDQKEQIKVQLSLALRAIVTQQLIPKTNGKGRVLACEVLKANSTVKNLIKFYALNQIQYNIQTGRKEGMQTMDQSLFDLYNLGEISRYELFKRASYLDDVKEWLRELSEIEDAA